MAHGSRRLDAALTARVGDPRHGLICTNLGDRNQMHLYPGTPACPKTQHGRPMERGPTSLSTSPDF
jgi:hypothetical protein